jgi:hypothetical protein
MAKATLNISVKGDLRGQLKSELNDRIARAAREAVAVMKPVVDKAVDRAIEKNKEDFIPTDDEAHELGIGSNGVLDRGKIDRAYRGMLTSANNGVTNTETEVGAGTGFGNIGSVRARVNFEVLFKTDLARTIATNTKKGQTAQDFLDIPWMEWLLDGASIQGWNFKDGTFDFSRTGGGIMRPGGLWQFPPARLGARDRLDQAMTEEVSKAAEKAIRDSINSVR